MANIFMWLLSAGCDIFFPSGYRIRSGKVYWPGGMPVKMHNIGADAKTFQKLGHYFGKDNQRVFWTLYEVKGADVASFVELGALYAKDNRKVYYCQSPLTEADVATFHIKEVKDTQGVLQIFGVDAGHVFSQGKLVSNDPAAFDFTNPKW